MNPLGQLISIAEANLMLRPLLECPASSSDAQVLPQGASRSNFSQYKGSPAYPTVELAGMAGSYLWALAQKNLNVIYANDLAYEVRGIDAVAKKMDTGRLLIVESKGTTRKLSSPATYLKTTKTMGRQLSWLWCWNAVISLAENPFTAEAFLALYKPMILGQVERCLAVTRVRQVGVVEGYQIEETRTWGEEELCEKYPWLAEEKDWGKLRVWLGELDEERIGKGRGQGGI